MIFGLIILVVNCGQRAYGDAAPIKVLSIGSAILVYDTARDGCSELDIPDAAAHAIRDSKGQIHLFSRVSLDHAKNRELVGADFEHLRRTCDIAFQGAGNANPAMYNDNGWLSSFFVENRTVYALVHNEWHGNENRKLCPNGSPECNEESISEVFSTDDGFHFKNFPNGKGLVAAFPYRYKRQAHFFGISGPTNIVKAGEYFYTLVAQIHPTKNELNGICALRTSNVADPASWRGWSGHDFSISFINPYRVNASDINKHLCVPLANKGLFDSSSLTWIPYRRSFLLVVRRQVWAKSHPELIGDTPGIYISESKDMIHWSRPALILSDKDAGGVEQMYPSLIDPTSTDPSFSTIGPNPLLFVATRAKGGGNRGVKLVARRLKLRF